MGLIDQSKRRGDMQYYDDDDLQESLRDTIREARNQLRSKPLYIVATADGYDIVDRLPESVPAYYRVNMDGTITLLVTEIETHKLLELHGYEHSTMTNFGFEEDKYA
jgi:hypothetical protein